MAKEVKTRVKLPFKSAKANLFAALLTSIIGNINDNSASLLKITVINPIMTEKKTTKAQTLRVFSVAFLTDLVKLKLEGKQYSEQLPAFFPIPKIIPTNIAEKIIERYKIIPSVTEPRREAPMPATIKAGPVLLEKAISLSHSSLLIAPSRYKSYAHFAPNGKPHITPITNGKIPLLLILKSLSKGLENKEKALWEILEYKKSLKIMKGKTEPIITL